MKCSVCARQFSDNPNEYTVTKVGAVADIGGAICVDCADGLDENGNFEGEIK